MVMPFWLLCRGARAVSKPAFVIHERLVWVYLGKPGPSGTSSRHVVFLFGGFSVVLQKPILSKSRRILT